MSVITSSVSEVRRVSDLARRTTTRTPADAAMAAYFKRMSHAAAARAAAFGGLARELVAWDAPGELVRGCEAARDVEWQHAIALGQLAATRGAPFDLDARAMASPRPVRPLLEIAIDNAVSGVVRGTYDATLARYCARTARDERVRFTMTAVARDACAGAELAIEIAAWLQAMIEPVEAAIVEDSLRHATVALSAALESEPEDGLPEAGMPTRRDQLVIWSRLCHRVWSVVRDRVSAAAA